MDALATQFPFLAATLPYVRLTTLPTPILAARALSERIGIEELTIKADDQSASLYGGNKVRKLEYLLADAQARQCDAVLTFGSAGSNHALATAIYARRLGLQCIAILTDQPQTNYVAATLRYHVRLGTQLLHAGGYHATVAAYESALASHPTGPERLYKVTWGGSSWLGATGFVAAGLEVAAQCAADPPDAVYVPCGTMGTAVGLAMGLRLAGLATRVMAVQVAPIPLPVREAFEKLFETTNRELRARDVTLPMLDMPMENVELREEFLGPGYAQPTPECLEAVALAHELEGISLDTTYTGKAMGALIQDARDGRLEGERIMFWNTYNSQPYPEDLDSVSAVSLPPPFRKYLAA